MATLFFIVLTIIITLTAWFVFPQWQHQGMLVPYAAWRGKKWHQLLSSGFLHADFMHLFVNMFVLLMFGLKLEQEIGSGLFVILYTSGLFASSLPTLLLEKNNPQYASIGASGAVEAVLFGYIIFFPLDKIYIIFIPVGIPAIIFGVLFLLYSYYETKKQRGNINHVAHIAGALYGALFILVTVPDALSRFIGHFN